MMNIEEILLEQVLNVNDDSLRVINLPIPEESNEKSIEYLRNILLKYFDNVSIERICNGYYIIIAEFEDGFKIRIGVEIGRKTMKLIFDKKEFPKESSTELII